MKTRICDICGAQVEHGFIYDEYGINFNSNTFKIKIWDSGVIKMDICAECANKIREICKAEKKKRDKDAWKTYKTESKDKEYKNTLRKCIKEHKNENVAFQESRAMRGFKAFNSDLTCNGFQYEIGKTYEVTGSPNVYERGFHFCRTIADCYDYYRMNEDTRICEIEALGEIDEEKDNNKLCTNKIKILNEITSVWQKNGNTNTTNTGYCNTGRYNTGDWNTFDYNTGSHNTGSHNTGDWNTGDYNAGYHNTGNYNTGMRNTGRYNIGGLNTGDFNKGRYNTGRYNTGDWNTGDYNTGLCNTGSYNNIGSRNTGDYNIGNWNTGSHNMGNNNTGDYNTGNWNTGVFCTEENPTIKIFNKESNWTMGDWLNCEARNILSSCPHDTIIFIDKDDMSEEEKQKHPEYNTIGGYLKVVIVEKSKKKIWWNKLPENERQEILNLPNFDKDIFFECTGIEIEPYEEESEDK